MGIISKYGPKINVMAEELRKISDNVIKLACLSHRYVDRENLTCEEKSELEKEATISCRYNNGSD